MLNAHLAFFSQKMLYDLSKLVYNNFERMCNFMQSITTISFNEFESILNNNKVEHMLQVAKERGWTVHKRVLLTDRNAYDYPVLNETNY